MCVWPLFSITHLGEEGGVLFSYFWGLSIKFPPHSDLGVIVLFEALVSLGRFNLNIIHYL